MADEFKIKKGLIVNGKSTMDDLEVGQVNYPSTDGTNGQVIATDGNGNLAFVENESGPQGPEGPIGPTGAEGPQGEQGLDGNDGVQGPTGATGPQGEQGVSGATGPQGDQGVTGAEGPQGEQGVTGATGPQGEQGVTGATGPQGDQGVTGATGPQGEQGLTGNDGADGPIGPQGVTGPIGPQGEQGLDGNDGIQGPIGPMGATGPQGEQGLDGNDGIQGPIGPTGEQGPQGPEGQGIPQGLQSVLTEGNETLGNEIILTSGDRIRGENAAGADPVSGVNIKGGSSLGSANGGSITLLGGDTVTGDFGGAVALQGGLSTSGTSGPVLINTLADSGNIFIGDTENTVQIQGLNYPNIDGNNGDFLQTDGNGNLFFSDGIDIKYSFNGDAGLPSTQGDWEENTTGSATIDIQTDSITSNQVVRINDNFTASIAELDHPLSDKDWRLFWNRGFIIEGKSRLDTSNGQDGFFAIVSLNDVSILDPSQTGGKEIQCRFYNDNGFLRLKFEGGPGFIYNGTNPDQPTVAYDEWFTWRMEFLPRFQDSKFFMNNVEATFKPNADPTVTSTSRIRITSGSTAGVNRITFQEYFAMISGVDTTNTLTLSEVLENGNDANNDSIINLSTLQGDNLVIDGGNITIGDGVSTSKIDVVGTLVNVEGFGSGITLKDTFDGDISIHGINYPKADGDNGDYLGTDGTGNLAFRNLPNETQGLNDVLVVNNISGGEDIVISDGDAIDFTPSLSEPLPQTEGKVFYDANRHSLSYFNNETKVDVGQEILIEIRNTTGQTIQAGAVCIINGSVGNTPTVELANASILEKAKTNGLATGLISDNSNGYLSIVGSIEGVDTSLFSEGDILYLDNFPGAITNIEPDIPVKVGICTVSAINGKIATILTQQEGLAQTLSIGNVTNGNDIIMSVGDEIQGESGTGTNPGAPVTLRPGSTEDGNAGTLLAVGGDTVNGNAGNVLINAGEASGTGSDGDVQISTFSGNTIIGNSSNDVTINNLTYPSFDGIDGQVLTTDGSGNLTFENTTGGAQNIEEVLTTGNNANGVGISNLGLSNIKDIMTIDAADLPTEGSVGTIRAESLEFRSTGTGIDRGLFLRSDKGGNITIEDKVDINGLKHPLTDGTDGQVMFTDGAGNLAFKTPKQTSVVVHEESGSVSTDSVFYGDAIFDEGGELTVNASPEGTFLSYYNPNTLDANIISDGVTIVGPTVVPAKSKISLLWRTSTEVWIEDGSSGSSDGIISDPASPVETEQVWNGTKAEYDAIGTKDPNTIYFIDDGTGSPSDSSWTDIETEDLAGLSTLNLPIPAAGTYSEYRLVFNDVLLATTVTSRLRVRCSDGSGLIADTFYDNTLLEIGALPSRDDEIYEFIGLSSAPNIIGETMSPPLLGAPESFIQFSYDIAEDIEVHGCLVDITRRDTDNNPFTNKPIRNRHSKIILPGAGVGNRGLVSFTIDVDAETITSGTVKLQGK